MTSLRAVSEALGYGNGVSVARDLLGFTGGRVPQAVVASRPVPAVSLRAHLERLRGPRFRVCLILAGSELIDSGDQLVIDYAVYRLRDIYAQAGLGVHIVRRDERTSANSAGHSTVLDSASLTDAGRDLWVDGQEVSVVIPDNMSVTKTETAPDGTVSVTVTLGRSPRGGGCGVRDSEGMRSAVVSINGETTGRTLAHEIGHFLGLPHPDVGGNTLMTQSGTVPGDPFSAVALSDAERSTVHGHCTIDRTPLPI